MPSGERGCPVCNGKGYVIHNQSTAACHGCEAVRKHRQGWIPGITAMESPVKTPWFATHPDMLVVHSGATAPGVAEYLVSRDAVARSVSCHFAWSTGFDGLVQMVSLQKQANHARGFNLFSIGIELPGPMEQDPRPEEQRIEFRHLVTLLLVEVPSIKRVTTHAHLDPDRRRDPGPGFTRDWVEGFGLKIDF